MWALSIFNWSQQIWENGNSKVMWKHGKGRHAAEGERNIVLREWVFHKRRVPRAWLFLDISLQKDNINVCFCIWKGCFIMSKGRFEKWNSLSLFLTALINLRSYCIIFFTSLKTLHPHFFNIQFHSSDCFVYRLRLRAMTEWSTTLIEFFADSHVFHHRKKTSPFLESFV